MNWFEGSIPDAIRMVREQSRTLLVFIKGTDEASKSMDQLFDADVYTACGDHIALRLDASSEATAQFSAVYAVLTVPCLYLISPSGRALDVKLGALEKSELIAWIKETIKQGSECLPEGNRDSTPSSSSTQPVVVQPTTSPETQASPVIADNPEPACSSQSLEERVNYAQQLLERKQRLQSEEEKKKVIETEMNRRQSGKALQELKERQRTMEIEESIAQRRKDEIENRKHLERLRQQIEDDRRAKEERARIMNYQNETCSVGPVPSFQNWLNTSGSVDCDQVRLQLRMVEGGYIVGKFSPGDTLAGDVRGWLDHVSRNEPTGTAELPMIEEETRAKLLNLCARGFRFRRQHPAKLFDPEEEAKSLTDLGLSPSAVLFLISPHGSNSFSIQSTNTGWLSQVYGVFQSGVSTFYNYVTWIMSGVYNFGAGLVSSVVPDRGAGPSTPRNIPTRPTVDEKGSTSAGNRAVRRQGNMARLSHLPDDSDDEQARWNGNSTEQL